MYDCTVLREKSIEKEFYEYKNTEKKCYVDKEDYNDGMTTKLFL